MTLDAQDYTYFRYTSPMLSNAREIRIQVQNFIANGGTLPRIFYRVCPSPYPEECFLSDMMARGFWDGDVILSEILNTTN